VDIIISSIIGVLALCVAVAGVMYAKKQFDLSKTTKTETEKLLDKIDRRTEEIKKISEDTQKRIDDQINGILKNFDPKTQTENKMMEAFMGAAISDPKMLSQVLEMAKNQSGKK
jgi:uncharacterized membrane protein YhiD involved in acid resistance